MMKRRGVTLVEVLVAAGMFAMVMAAVLSFYVEAVAVSAKRNQNSARLRRFHIGLDKMEQILREARVVDVTPRAILFLKLADEPEVDGFPSYDPAPAQFASAKQGVVMVQDGKEIPILPTETGEHVIFEWVQENPLSSPPAPAEKKVLSVALYYSGGDERSGLFFHRTVNVPRY